MMATAAPGLVLFSLSFGLVGLFVGAAFFIPPPPWAWWSG